MVLTIERTRLYIGDWWRTSEIWSGGSASS
jgi:hypothetical protein